MGQYPVEVFSGTTLMIQTDTLIGATIIGSGNNLAMVAYGGELVSCTVAAGGSAIFSGGSAAWLNVTSGGSATVFGGLTAFSDLTISANSISSGTAMLIESGDVFVKNATVSGNTGYSQGGAITVLGGSLEIAGGKFNGNTVSGFTSLGSPYNNGGAVYAFSATLDIHDAIFSGNHAEGAGGAIFISNGDLTLTDTDFTGNSARCANYGGGGALRQTLWRTSGDYSISISECAFSGNECISKVGPNMSASSYGGGAAMFSLTTESGKVSFSIADSVFFNNRATSMLNNGSGTGFMTAKFMGGGGMFMSMSVAGGSGRACVRNTDFTGNAAFNNGLYDHMFNGGGAAYLIIGSGNELNFSGCTFAGNYAVASAFYNSSTQTVSARTYGGAICAYGGGTVVMENTVFRNNSVSCSGEYAASATTLRLYGGAIYAGGSTTVRFTYGGNSRYCNTDNRAEAGGFLYLDQNASAVFNFSSSTTFENNVANSGGFMYLNGATAEFNIGQGLVIIGHDPIDDILVWGVPAAALTPNLTTDSIAGSGTIIINGGSYSEFQLRGDASKFTGNWVIKENSYMSLRGYGNGINNVSIASGAKLIAVAPRLSGASVAAGGTLAVLGGSGIGLDVYGTLMAGTDRCGGTAITNAVIHSGGSIVRFNDTPYHADWWNLYYDCEPTLTNVTLENGAYAILGNSWTGKTFKLGCASTASAALLNTASATYLDPTASKGSATSLAITSGSNLAVLSGGAVLAGSGRGFEVANAKLTVLSGATLSGGTIYSGGNLVLSSGGTVRGGKLHSGGSAVFYGGYAEYLDVSSGGRVLFYGGSSTLYHSLVSGHTASAPVIELSSANAWIDRSVISGNSMTFSSSGAGIVRATGSGGSLRITDSIFADNDVPSEQRGTSMACGALYASGITLDISGTKFSDNSTAGIGAAAYIVSCSVTIKDCDFNNNYSRGYRGGGALYIYSFGEPRCDTIISGCTFEHNVFVAISESYDLSGGGAVFMLGGTNVESGGTRLSMSESIFSGNHVEHDETFSGNSLGGGAMYLSQYYTIDTELSSVTFADNYVSASFQSARLRGGAIVIEVGHENYPDRGSQINFSKCVFNGNFLTGGIGVAGGAIMLADMYKRYNGYLSLSNCSFTGNYIICNFNDPAEYLHDATAFGGAIEITGTVTCDIANSDFTGNYALCKIGEDKNEYTLIGGGAIHADSANSVAITDCRFTGNHLDIVWSPHFYDLSMIEAYGGAISEVTKVSSVSFIGNYIAQTLTRQPYFWVANDSYLLGGAMAAHSAAIIENSIFSGNYLSYQLPMPNEPWSWSHAHGYLYGGAVYLGSGGTITDTVFRDNFASDGTATKGGAIYLAGNTTISDTFFVGNSAVSNYSATQGGAVYLAGGSAAFFYNDYPDSYSRDSSNISNSATAGGFLYLARSTSATFNVEEYASMSFTGNMAASGGVFYLENNANITFNIGEYASCVFSNNIANTGGFMYINGGIVTFNTAQTGYLRISSSTTGADSIAGNGTIVVAGNVSIAADVSKFTGNWVIKENSYMSLRGYGNCINNVSIASGAKLIAETPILSGASVAAGGTLAVLGGSGIGLDVYGTLMAGTDTYTRTAITNAVIHSGGSITGFDNNPHHVEWGNMYDDCEPTLTNVTLEAGASAALGNTWNATTFKLGCASTASAAMLNTDYATYLDWRYPNNMAPTSATSIVITSGRNLAALTGNAVLTGTGFDFEIASGQLTVASGGVLSAGRVASDGTLVIYSGAMALGTEFVSGSASAYAYCAEGSELVVDDGAKLYLHCFNSNITVRVNGSGSVSLSGLQYSYPIPDSGSTVTADYYGNSEYQAAGWDDHAQVCSVINSNHESSYSFYNLLCHSRASILEPSVGSNRCIEITSGGSFYQADGTIDQVIVRSGGELGLSPGYATDQSSSRIVATNIIIESGGSVNALTCNRFAASGFCELDRTGIRTTVSAGTIVYSGGITSGHNLRGSYNQTILGNAELITWANYYSILTIDSGASVTGLELLLGASVLLNSGAKLSGSLDVALYHPKDGGASVRNLTSFDGITLKVNADALTSDCGAFTIVSGVTADTITVTLAGVDHVLVLNQTVALANGSYTYRTEGNSMILDVTGKFDSVCGQSGTSSTLKVSDCRVKSIIAGASGDVTGSVTASIELAAAASPCNIYGGGNNANVGGKISLSLTGGGYTGTIYGGSRAYQKTISTGDVAIAVGAIVQTNNVKILKSGESAWVVGGGTAYDGTLKAGTVSITIDGASLVHVVGGAQAQTAGTVATVASTAITIRNAAISGDVFGGGYAYDHAESTVLGDVSMTFDASNSKMITVQGGIYGGGANPSHPSMGGSSVVEGDATITFTGSGDYLAVSTVSGDGKVAGTVLGVKTLSFAGFTGDFLGSIQSFDVVSFSGNTVMDYSGGYAASTIAFDLTGRTELEAFADGFRFVDGGDNLLKIELGATTGSYDLLTCDDFDALEGLKVELYKQGALYASFDYGDSAKGYTVGERNGCLALLA